MTFNRDIFAGIVVIALGLFFAKAGLAYDIGTLFEMGSGFIPVTVAILMIGVGILIEVTALIGTAEAEDEVAPKADWRGILCIVAGIGSFIALGEVAGMAIATFFCVFISALGDRSATLKQTAIFATGMTVFCVAVFSYGLGLQLPLWPQLP